MTTPTDPPPPDQADRSNDSSIGLASDAAPIAGEDAAPTEGGGAEDTAPLSPEDASEVSLKAAEEAMQQVAKGGTNVDTLVGRLVVDQGLATPEEVEHCLAVARADQNEDRSAQSLAQMLVDREYVTKRQIARLKQILEAERSGQKIPGYKIISKLGAGAMAAVYRAKQISLDREVAIKILPRKFSSNPQFIERFYAEGRAAAQLNHPNIVQAFDVGKAGDYHYFVMEYVDGRTVHDDIDAQKRLNEEDAVAVTIQVAEALEHAHNQGLIHRDVKPKNIMLTGRGSTASSVAKLADMGLARAVSDEEAAQAERGKAFGTPYYISPEQIRGETEVGPPADIYSLGATLYHMVTGSVPFEGKNPSEVMRKHIKTELVPPDHVNAKLSAGISEVIEMMMAKKTADRYPNCRDLLVDLKAVAAGETPPIAHKDVFSRGVGEELAQIEAAATAMSEIPVDSSLGPTQRTVADLFREPLVVILLLLLAGSIVINLLWIAGAI